MTRYAIWAGLAIWTALAAPLAAQDAAPKVVATVDIPRGNRPIIVPVVFHGRQYEFLLDTTSRSSVFDARFRHLLGDAKEPNLYYAQDAKVGGVSMILGGAVLCADLAELREVSGRPIMGVLGAGFLRHYAVQIDFDAGKLRLIESDLGKHSEWGTLIRAKFTRDATPLIGGTVARKYAAPFSLDTGYAETGALSRQFFDRIVEDDVAKPVTVQQVGAAQGSFEGQVVRVPEFAVGLKEGQDDEDLTVETVEYSFENKGLVFDRAGGSCRLGIGYLSRFQVTIDYPGGRIYLKKGKRFDLRDEADMSGLHIQARSGRIVADAVTKDSPADKAGIHPGDVLAKVGDTFLEGLTFDQARTLAAQESAAMAFRRSGVFHRKPGSGLKLVWEDPGVFLHTVDEGSPGWQAGLRSGDILLEVDGKQVTGPGLMDLRQLLQSKTGRKLDVVFKRGGKAYRTAEDNPLVLKPKL